MKTLSVLYYQAFINTDTIFIPVFEFVSKFYRRRQALDGKPCWFSILKPGPILIQYSTIGICGQNWPEREKKQNHYQDDEDDDDSGDDEVGNDDNDNDGDDDADNDDDDDIREGPWAP